MLATALLATVRAAKARRKPQARSLAGRIHASGRLRQRAEQAAFPCEALTGGDRII
jgi:hypothetical protein